MYEMKKEYMTGIDTVDKEHERLFAIADQAYYVIKDEYIPDKYDYIVEIIDGLKEYAANHFRHEEEYMESIQFKQLFSQKVAHAEFMEKLEEYDMESVDSNQKEVLLELLDFLNDWLVHHILERDILIGK